MMQNLNFWVYNKELRFDQFREELEKIFDIRELFHDTENYWEYMFGDSKKFQCRVNISRPNQWEQNNLSDSVKKEKNEIPLHLIFYGCNPAFTDQIGNELNHYFKLPVYQGIVSKIPDTDYGYNFIKQRIYNKIDFSGLIKIK
ncbi:MAG: hypothetical protein ACO1N0_10295 [Fluviicola sp.]